MFFRARQLKNLEVIRLSINQHEKWSQISYAGCNVGSKFIEKIPLHAWRNLWTSLSCEKLQLDIAMRCKFSDKNFLRKVAAKCELFSTRTSKETVRALNKFRSKKPFHAWRMRKHRLEFIDIYSLCSDHRRVAPLSKSTHRRSLATSRGLLEHRPTFYTTKQQRYLMLSEEK